MKKKMLVLSDSPGASTGLGGQAQLLVEAGMLAGYDVAAIGFHQPTMKQWPPPRGKTNGGTRIWMLPHLPERGELLYVIGQEDPDLIVGLADFWQLAPLHWLPERYWNRCVLWLTADCDFYDPSLEPFLTKVAAVVAMSEYGRGVWSALEKAGGRVEYIPHAVKPSLTEPPDLEAVAKTRARLGLTDSFIALHIGRNQLRKMQPHLIDGWARFVRSLSPADRARVKLYLHTEEKPAPFAAFADALMAAYAQFQVGFDLPTVIRKHFADVAETIAFSERNAADGDLRNLYAMSDVFVNVALGEGFSVPTIEAPACGRAVIAADNTTTPELVGGKMAQPYDSDTLETGHRCFEIIEEGCHAFNVLMTPEETNAVAPFGIRVPCSTRLMQPDIVEWRGMVDVDALANAFAAAHVHWQNGNLNSAQATARRRDWILARYGWTDVRDRWTALLKNVSEPINATRTTESA